MAPPKGNKAKGQRAKVTKAKATAAAAAGAVVSLDTTAPAASTTSKQPQLKAFFTVQAVLDMKFKQGLVSSPPGRRFIVVDVDLTHPFASSQQYRIRTSDGQTKWVGHRDLTAYPQLIEAFHAQERARLATLLDQPDRQPHFLCGLAADPLTGQLQFLVKWQQQDELHLQPAAKLMASRPKLVIEYLQARIRPRSVRPGVLNGQLLQVQTGFEDDHRIVVSADTRRGARIVRRVLSALWHEAELLYLVEWTDGESDFVRAAEAAARYPQLVYEYLEKLVDRQSLLQRQVRK